LLDAAFGYKELTKQFNKFSACGLFAFITIRTKSRQGWKAPPVTICVHSKRRKGSELRVCNALIGYCSRLQD